MKPELSESRSKEAMNERMNEAARVLMLSVLSLSLLLLLAKAVKAHAPMCFIKMDKDRP